MLMSKLILSESESICTKSLSELMHAIWALRVRVVTLRLVLLVSVMVGLDVLLSVFTCLTVSLVMSK